MAATSSKPFSISFGSNKAKPRPSPSTNPKKRKSSALAEPDSDHEEQVQTQLVTGFDQSAGGAVNAAKAPDRKPLTIPKIQNRNWRAEARRKHGKNLLPPEVQAAQNGTNGATVNAVIERGEVSNEAGLRFIARDQDGDTAMTNGHSTTAQALPEPEKKHTAEEEAIEALMGMQKESTLVIRASDAIQDDHITNGATQPDEYMDDNDRYRADVKSRPESCSLEEYAQIPVEEFGAAMLRGMGWKEGQIVGKSNDKARAPRIVERRPALLGIGAKEVPGGLGDELGAWGKVAKGKKKVDMAYNPIMLKNSKTGEMLTEEELEQKKAEAKKGEGDEDWRNRRDRNLAADKERKKDRLAIEDGRNDDYRRRNRSRSKGRRRDEDSRKDGSHSGENSRHSPSRRDRNRSPDRSRHGSSRKDRSRSRERKYRREGYNDDDRRRKDHDRYDRDHGRR